MRPPVKFVPKAPHHLYTGIFIMCLGGVFRLLAWLCEPYALYDAIYNPAMCMTYICLGSGALIAVDDILEHTISGNTPLRIFAEKALFPFLRWLRDRK